MIRKAGMVRKRYKQRFLVLSTSILVSATLDKREKQRMRIPTSKIASNTFALSLSRDLIPLITPKKTKTHCTTIPSLFASFGPRSGHMADLAPPNLPKRLPKERQTEPTNEETLENLECKATLRWGATQFQTQSQSQRPP